MITWADKVTFVGMVVETVFPDAIGNVGSYAYNVKIGIPGGLCSYGNGSTREKAIESAAWGIHVDWWSVEQRMTEFE